MKPYNAVVSMHTCLTTFLLLSTCAKMHPSVESGHFIKLNMTICLLTRTITANNMVIFEKCNQCIFCLLEYWKTDWSKKYTLNLCSVYYTFTMHHNHTMAGCKRLLTHLWIDFQRFYAYETQFGFFHTATKAFVCFRTLIHLCCGLIVRHSGVYIYINVCSLSIKYVCQ